MIKFVPMTPHHINAMPADARPRLCMDSQGVVAEDEQGNMQAIAIMDSWSANSCHIHVTILNPWVLRNGFQQEVFGFIFGADSGRELVIGVTPDNNAKALKFNKNMGFVEIARIPDGCEVGVDYIVTTLKKQDCRWIDQPARRIQNV